MLELNKVMVIGNLTRDPELSYLTSGTALAKLGLAVNRHYKGRDGEQREETSFLDVEAWGAQAEFCSKWLKKGKRIFVEGRLKQDRWEAPDGTKRSKVRISADRIQFADTRQDDSSSTPDYVDDSSDDGPDSSAAPAPRREARPQAAAASFPEPAAESADTDDDLPF